MTDEELVRLYRNVLKYNGGIMKTLNFRKINNYDDVVVLFWCGACVNLQSMDRQPVWRSGLVWKTSGV